MNLDRILFGMVMGFFGMAIGASLGEAVGKTIVLQISFYSWILCFTVLLIRAYKEQS